MAEDDASLEGDTSDACGLCITSPSVRKYICVTLFVFAGAQARQLGRWPSILLWTVTSSPARVRVVVFPAEQREVVGFVPRSGTFAHGKRFRMYSITCNQVTLVLLTVVCSMSPFGTFVPQ